MQKVVGVLLPSNTAEHTKLCSCTIPSPAWTSSARLQRARCTACSLTYFLRLCVWCMFRGPPAWFSAYFHVIPCTPMMVTFGAATLYQLQQWLLAVIYSASFTGSSCWSICRLVLLTAVVCIHVALQTPEVSVSNPKQSFLHVKHILLQLVLKGRVKCLLEMAHTLNRRWGYWRFSCWWKKCRSNRPALFSAYWQLV